MGHLVSWKMSRRSRNIYLVHVACAALASSNSELTKHCGLFDWRRVNIVANDGKGLMLHSTFQFGSDVEFSWDCWDGAACLKFYNVFISFQCVLYFALIYLKSVKQKITSTSSNINGNHRNQFFCFIIQDRYSRRTNHMIYIAVIILLVNVKHFFIYFTSVSNKAVTILKMHMIA